MEASGSEWRRVEASGGEWRRVDMSGGECPHESTPEVAYAFATEIL